MRVRSPLKLFGDIHGQFADLQRFFAAYGSPNPFTGDVEYVGYLFLGDYVDRGKFSLECVCLLLALKICHPSRVTLLRGNHEDPQVNAAYGFRAECLRRCRDGAAVWAAVNTVFEMLPVAALIDRVVLCVHGGIGENLETLQQLKELPRPCKVDLGRRSILNEVSRTLILTLTTSCTSPTRATRTSPTPDPNLNPNLNPDPDPDPDPDPGPPG